MTTAKDAIRAIQIIARTGFHWNEKRQSWEFRAGTAEEKPMTITEAIKSDPRKRRHPGFGLCTCRICGKRGTGAVVRRHIRRYHLGESGIGVATLSDADRAFMKSLRRSQKMEGSDARGQT